MAPRFISRRLRTSSNAPLRACAASVAILCVALAGSIAGAPAAMGQQTLQGAVGAAPAQTRPSAPAPARPAPARALPAIAPLPPPRPAELRAAPSAPDAPRTPDPARTGSTPPAAAPLLAPLAPAPNLAPAPPAQPAPLASPEERAALRACAEEWRRLQMLGEDKGALWREFSAGCLAGRAARAAQETPSAPMR